MNVEIIVVVIILVIVFFACAAILKTPKVKGFLGERKIAKLLQKVAKKRDGYVINNIIIPHDGNNLTSQIDHLIILNAGIVCIETKNYSGRIYGNENQLKWTQVLAYGKQKNSIYNPVKQNQTHMETLAKHLNISNVYGYVVFVQGNNKYVNSKNVLTPRQLKKYLLKFDNNALTSDEMLKLYTGLTSLKETNVSKEKEHIKHVKAIQNETMCPYCGGELIVRKSKNGNKFLGCSNYPKCKYTRKIK